MSINYGFVYVLSNPLMIGVYKIGMTDRSPSQRIAELNSSTSIPTEFRLILCAEVVDARESEAMLHRELGYARINSKREFFRLDAGELGWLEEQLVDLSEDRIFYRTEEMDYVEHMNNLESIKAERNLKISWFFDQNADPIDWGDMRIYKI